MTNVEYGFLCHVKVIALVHELFDTPSYFFRLGQYTAKNNDLYKIEHKNTKSYNKYI